MLCTAFIQYTFVKHPPRGFEYISAGKFSLSEHNIYKERNTDTRTMTMDGRAPLCQALGSALHLTNTALILKMTSQRC